MTDKEKKDLLLGYFYVEIALLSAEIERLKSENLRFSETRLLSVRKLSQKIGSNNGNYPLTDDEETLLSEILAYNKEQIRKSYGDSIYQEYEEKYEFSSALRRLKKIYETIEKRYDKFSIYISDEDKEFILEFAKKCSVKTKKDYGDNPYEIMGEIYKENGFPKDMEYRTTLEKKACDYEVSKIENNLTSATRDRMINLLKGDISALYGAVLLPIYNRIKSSSDEEVEDERKRLLSEKEAERELLIKELESLEERVSSFEDRENALISQFLSTKKEDRGPLTSSIEKERKELFSNKKRISEIGNNLEKLDSEIDRLRNISIQDLREEMVYNAMKLKRFAIENVDFYVPKDINDPLRERELSRYETNFSAEYNSIRMLYENILKNGVNPINQVFASVAEDENRTKLIIEAANKYLKLMEELNKLPIGSFSENDLNRSYDETFVGKSHEKYGKIDFFGRATPLFWKWVCIDQNLPVEDVIKALEKKIGDLKEIELKVDSKYPKLPISFDEIEEINEELLRNVSKLQIVINPEEYEQLVSEIQGYINSDKRKSFRGYKFEEKLSERKNAILMKVKKFILKYETARGENIFEERMDTFVDDNASDLYGSKDASEYANKFDVLNNSLPYGVLYGADFYEILLEKLKKIGAPIKEDSESKMSELDKKIGNSLENISYISGIKLSPAVRKIFPEPIGKTKSQVLEYTDEDVKKAYQTYNLEMRIARLIEKTMIELQNSEEKQDLDHEYIIK